MPSDWITTELGAAISGYSADYLRRLIRSGKLKAKKWGREWQLSHSALEAYVRQEQALGARRGRKPIDRG